MEKTFDNGAGSSNYVERSNGGVPLLLLHGMASMWQSFSFLIPHLEKDFHVFAMDLRGHGKSHWASSYKIGEFIPDIASFIEKCIKEPTVIFGHSYGGMLGIMTAAQYPELVKGLILGDSIISLDFLKEFSLRNKDTTIFWRHLANETSFEGILTELKNQPMPVPNQEGCFAPAYKVIGENNPYFQFLASTLYQLDPEILMADIDCPDETYSEFQVEKLFPKIQCPVLLLQANPKLGGLMRDEDINRVLTLLPREPHHVRIHNAGHFLITEDVESVAKATISFLEFEK